MSNGPAVKLHEFEHGMTIKELKAAINEWPELDSNGEPNNVWVETGAGLSSLATSLWPLSGEHIELCSNAFDDAPSPYNGAQAVQLLRAIVAAEPYFDDNDYGNQRCVYCGSTDSEPHKGSCVHAKAKAFLDTLDTPATLAGPIQIGDKLIWEPNLSHAREEVVVTAIHKNAKGEMTIETSGPRGRQWNDESRMREACARAT